MSPEKPKSFDPRYALRQTATESNPSSFGELLKTELTEEFLEEAANYFDRFIEVTKENNPDIRTYELFRTMADQLPKRIPFEAQQKALEASASMDSKTKRLGQQAFLLLNMKTLLTVVDSYSLEEVDTEKDQDERDEMVSAAILSVLEKFPNLSSNLPIPQQIHRAARNGAAECLAKRDRFIHQRLINKRDKGTLVLEDDTDRGLIEIQLRKTMEEVLGTLSPRERRVLELRYGVKDDIERKPKEVGRELDLTRERIKRIEAEALRKLRHPVRSRRLREYLDVDSNEIARHVRPYSIEWFNIPENIKRQLISSGIREIADFFSASPSEIAEGWTGDSADLSIIVKALLESLGVGDNSIGESDPHLLRHITDGILYRENRSTPHLLEGERRNMYRKALEELASFFSSKNRKE